MIKFLGGENISFALQRGHIIAIASVILAGFIALYTLRSIGLYKLAKAQGIKCKLLAVFPFVWLYVAIKLIEEGKFFGVSLKKLTVLFTVIASIAAMANIAYQIIVYYPLALNLFNDQATIYVDIGANLAKTAPGLKQYTSSIFVDSFFYHPYFNIDAVNTALNVVYYVGMAFDLMTIVIKITIFFAIFRKYWPQKMFLAAILSIFVEGIAFPICIFLIRNKKPVNYEEYMRRKYQYYRNPYGAYGQGGSFTQNQQPNPYQQNQYQNKTESPFSDFSENRKVDPFEEFSNSKNDDPFNEFSKDQNKEEKND